MSNSTSESLVVSYIRALDNQDYDSAAQYLADDVQIKGPSGEMFSRPREFINMLRQYRGKYDVKKIFTDQDDVCLIYDLITHYATVFMCSLYHTKDGKIASVRTIFDPSPFGQPPAKQTS